MTIQRKLIRIDRPAAQPGFLGAGHTARPVVGGGFAQTDPFILLMDDVLDKKDTHPVGGAHPHAGFETVSLLLEGTIGDDAHTMQAGDFQIMTAGSGIVHSETIDKISRMRLLQLWLSLPKKDRWATPRIQDLRNAQVPTAAANGVSLKLYSGALAGLVSPVQNHTPLIVADLEIEPGVDTVLQIPAHFNAFLYVLSGSVSAGADEKELFVHETGWLDVASEEGESELRLRAGAKGARFVLYAGQPTGAPIVSHGPFIGDGQEDIVRLYSDYRQGRMLHIREVPEAQQILL